MLWDWKSRAGGTLKGKGFDTVIKLLNPNMDPAEWRMFCESFKSNSSEEVSAYYCNLRSKVRGNHRLDPGGYKATDANWTKEAADLEAVGKPAPFLEH